MATIGSITVGLTAKTDRFNKKMKKSSGTVAKFGKAVGGIAKKVAAFGAIVGGAAIGGLVLLTKNSLEAIDATAKLSDQITIGTEDLLGYQHAAQLSGVAVEDFNQGLRDTVRMAGEAEGGNAGAIETFEGLGISLDKLRGMDNAQIFEAVADGVSKISDSNQRAAASVKLFGDNGQKMMNLLQQGSGAIKGMSAEAEKLGLTYSRIDAAKVEQFNDAWLKAGSIFSQIGNVLAVKLAPFMTHFINLFTEGVVEAGGFGAAVGNALKWIANGIGKVVNLFDLFKAGLSTLSSGVLTLGGVFARVFDGMKGVFLTIVGVVQDGIATMLRSLAGSIARVEEFAKNTVVRAKFAVGLLSDFERAKAEGRNREEKRARVQQIVGAAGGLEKSAAQSRLAGGKALDDAITGRSSKLFDDAAKVAATSAITAFDRYQAGTGAKETAAWFEGIQSKAEGLAEDTVKKVAAVNAQAQTTTTREVAGATVGSFNVNELAGSRAVTTQEQQLKTQKQIVKSIDNLTATVAESGGLG